jgi:hypothetical protein
MRGGRGKEMSAGHRSFDTIERALRRRKFGTLSTLTEQTRPHATGVVYAVSGVSEPLVLYVTTRTTTRKARNVAVYPDVAFVVPVPRHFPRGFPPRCIQFQGTATVLPDTDEGAIRAFRSSWFLRRILTTEQRIVAQGGQLCFIRIRPDPTVFTYGIGVSLWDNLRRPKEAIGRAAIPAGRR